jgi:hypothetical protein
VAVLQQHPAARDHGLLHVLLRHGALALAILNLGITEEIPFIYFQF